MNTRPSAALPCLRPALVALGIAILGLSSAWAQESWWKGNLHTHTLWSDGDDYPEMVLDWYKSRGYHFVALSDHNILSQGTKWVHPEQAIDEEPRNRLRLYLERFGDDWVEIDRTAGQTAVRLKTFDEYSELMEEPGSFLVIQAEEITADFQGRPVHVNATNVAEFIPPRGGKTLLEVFRNNIDAVWEQRRRTRQRMFPHLNHPNFRDGITIEEFASILGERFFEVYNGHQGVFNDGGPEKVSTEKLWDHALTRRLTMRGQPLYGLAVDDAHVFARMTTAVPNPGRGWVQVRAAELTTEAIVEAMEAGNFYASSGVELDELHSGDGRIALRIRAEPGEVYITQFIGTKRLRRVRLGEIGEVLHQETGLEPSYDLRGDELYVRARIVSTRPKHNGYRDGEVEMAWTQPLLR
ncbi:MAG: histidinol-phosphatase [Acidobacteriota bacterium]|nr:histidinol-phosphatase [Acidobacteriota bacterium]